MSKKVSRNLAESKKKIQDVAQRQVMPDSPDGPSLRKSPAGRRLEALRKRKSGG